MRPRSSLAFISVVAALFFGACSSSDGAAAKPQPPERPAEDEQARRQAALAQLDQRQEAACQRLTPAIVRCTIEDARETMPPEEVAKLEVEQLIPRLEAEWMEVCTSSKLSLRQIQVYESCAVDSPCAEFHACTAKAGPQP